jgi:hypothetical protein
LGVREIDRVNIEHDILIWGRKTCPTFITSNENYSSDLPLSRLDFSALG